MGRGRRFWGAASQGGVAGLWPGIAVMVVALVAAVMCPAGAFGVADAAESLTQQRELSAQGDGYRVTVVYDDAAGLPEGTTLHVSCLEEGTDEYRAARDAALGATRGGGDAPNEVTLGMLALDIGFLDADGNDVEPTGDVRVSIETDALQQDATPSNVEVCHIITVADTVGGDTDAIVAWAVSAEVTLGGGTAVAEFSSDAFSLFTITWTRDTSSAQRVGSASLHVVDPDGDELDDVDTYTTSELTEASGESGILVLADWVKTKAQDGRAYSEARLGSLTGTVVTGLKVAEERATSGGTTTTSYALQYTSDANPSSSSAWADVTDSIAGAAKSTADVYLVFRPTDDAPITLHYIDTEGNAIRESKTSSFTVSSSASAFRDAWNGYTLTGGSNFPVESLSGYTYQGDYLGPVIDDDHLIPRGYAVQYRWSTSDQGWQTGIGASARDTSSTHRAYAGYLTDVYRVYAGSSSAATTRTITVHYVDETKQAISGQADETVTLDSSEGTQELMLDSGSLVRDVEGRAFVGSYLGSTEDSLTENAGYVTTDYPHVSRVRLSEDGTLSYLLQAGGGPFGLSMTRSNRWAHTTANGRTFTLRREVTGSGSAQSERYSLVDDQASSDAIELDLVSAEGAIETYRGTFSADGTSTVYTVTATSTTTDGRTSTSYVLDVAQWMQNGLTDVYQVYGGTSTLSNPTIEVENDLVYSGNLVVRLDAGLEEALAGEGVSDVSYTWHKVVNDTSDDATGTLVERRQNGTVWNVAEDASQRSWLNLAADEGALSSTRQSVAYYCVLSYTYEGTTYTATSNRLSMINYDELQNGSFETPAMTTNQVSNAWYYPRGIWRTTGLGTGGALNRDIEVVNTGWGGTWWRSYNFASARAFQAADGSQFAELNCEAAGALYQDVVTLPYESLSYWLSHRARGSRATSTPEYDTMYLVIMPTRLAMTSASDGGELKEQADLEAFIGSHGGFATSLASAEEAVVTYRDENSGILIEHISSSDQAWHRVEVANGYAATAGLTRFFFVAGPTASGSNTVGNFLDAVGFTQELPQPSSDEFQLVVTKTFSGLTTSEIAQLADSFRLTVRAYGDEAAAEGRVAAGEEDDPTTSTNGDLALDHATLTFSAGTDGRLSPQAHDAQGTDLLALSNGSSGTVVEDDEAGTVTLTWTLLYNEVEGTRYYAVDETGQALAGYTAATSQTGGVTAGDGTSTELSAKGVATVAGGSTLRVAYANSYNRNSQITVQKTFSGITPTTVRELAAQDSPYTVTLTRSGGAGGTDATLHLVYDEARPYADAALPAGVDGVSVSFAQGTGGTSVITWAITGWDAGTYQVSESNYHPQGEASRYNTLFGIAVNGVQVSESDGTATAKVEVGGSGEGVPTVVADPGGAVGDVPEGGSAAVADAETNLLVVSYQNGDSTGYLVWTPQTAGANLRQAILNHIRGVFGDDEATLAGISFFASQSVSTMQVNDATVTYDPSTRALAFQDGANTTWQRYYATAYTLERDGQEVSPDEAEIRITNSYSPIVKLRKVEEGRTDRLLAGATFHVWRYAEDGGTKELYLGSGTTSSPVFGQATESTPAKDFVTGADGTVVVGVLPEGTYHLEETSAPDGYLRVAGVTFAVGSDGVVQLLDGDSVVSRTDVAEVTLTDPYYTITVSDSVGSSLPLAGGPGGIALNLVYFVGLGGVALLCGRLAAKRRRG